MATLNSIIVPETGTPTLNPSGEAAGHADACTKAELLAMLERLTPRELTWFKELFKKNLSGDLATEDMLGMCKTARWLADESGRDFVDCFYEICPDVPEQGGAS